MGVVTETFRITGVDKAVRDMEALAKAAEETKAKFGEIPRIEMPSSFEAFKADMDEGAAATQRLSGSMGSLAQQMPDVITQLASGGNVLQVFTQQGLQVVQANQALLASLTALGPGLAALAGAATMLGGAYFRLNEASIEQAQAQDVVAAASANLVNWSDTLRTAEIDLAEATGKLTEAEAARARLAITTQGLWLQSTEELRAKQMELRREQESVTTQLVDMATKFLGVVDKTGAWSAVLDMTTDSSEDIQRSLDAVNVALGQQTEEARKTTEALNNAATAKVTAAKASETHAKALDEEAEAAQRAMDAFGALAAQAVLVTDPNQLQTQKIATMQALLAEPGSMATLQASMGGGGVAAGLGMGGGGGLGQVIGKLISALSGNLSVILSALPPPWGQIAAALLALLSGGEGAVVKALQGVFDLVDNVLKAIPDLLMTLFDAEALPAMLIALVGSLAPLIEGILVGAGELVIELIDALPSISIAILQAVPDIIAALVRGLGVLVIDLVHAIVVDLPQTMIKALQNLLTLNGQGFTGIGGDWRSEWGKRGGWRDRGGMSLQINGMVGDSWRLGQGIRSLFDRDFGRTGGRF